MKLSRAELNHADAALGREWLVTNGLGGFASGTIALANVQTLHGQRSSRPASLTWAGALVVPMTIIVASGLLRL